MDYQQSRAYIKDAEKYGSVLGLDNMRELMRRLGNPQEQLKYVHVAGTNGKGSFLAYLYSTLSETGYRVGRYISPAIYSYRERMEVAYEPVSREKFAEYLTKIATVIEGMTADGLAHPTPFEIETAVAFLFFADEKCDLVLLEVGMGGDMDATNIIPAPVLATLVSISIDHEDFLGKTLGEIAQKKAGIVKKGCRVVSAEQKEEAEEVIRRVCLEQEVALKFVEPKKAEVLKESVFGQTFCYEGETYEIPLAGVHQIENAVLALEALQILDECGYPTTLVQRKQGMKKTVWGGRFTVIHEKPLFIVDGAHNPAAADKLALSVEHFFEGKKIHYIMGIFKDKEYDYVIDRTCPYAHSILTVETPGNPRAFPAEELAVEIGKRHANVKAAESLEDAVEKAFARAGEEDVILAFGSLSFLGELTRIVKGKNTK